MKKTLISWKYSFAIFSAVFFLLVLLTGCPGAANNNPESDKTEITLTLVNENGEELYSTKYTKEGDNTCTINVPDTYKEKKGYKFIKFVDLEGNEVKTFTEDIKVRVVFEPIQYTVVFKRGLAGSSQEANLPESITVKYDEEFTVPENTLSYSNKKSSGWYMQSGDEKKTFSNGDKQKNLTDINGKTVELIADFTDFDCVVKFGNKKTYYLDKNESLAEVPEVAAKTGYTVDGWYDSSDTTQTIIDFTNYKVTKSVEFKEKYTPKSYTVHFVTSHSTAPEDFTIVADGSSLQLSGAPYQLSAKGYIFEGWFDENNQKCYGFAAFADNWADGDLQDITLTAKWTPKKVQLVFVDAPLNLDPVPEGFSYQTKYVTNHLKLDVDYDTTVTIPGTEIYSDSVPAGYKFLGWSIANSRDSWGDYNANHKLDYAVGSSFKNDIDEDKEIYLYAYIEGPAIKINIPVPESVVLDDSASIKPSSLNNSLYFWNVTLYADGNNEDSISLKSNGKMSSYVIKKDNYFVLNKTCAKDSDLEGFFSSGSHTYEVIATLKAGSSDSIVYKQTKALTVNSGVQGDDILLEFNDLTPYTNAGTANLYGYLFLNFITGDSITVEGIKFADETNGTRITNNEWSKRTFGDDIGTKQITLYITKDGQNYSAPITVQTAGGCISAGTVLITNDLKFGVVQ